MSMQQRVFAILVSLTIFIVIIGLVKNRRLKEEYSWLWLFTGAGIIILVLWYDLLLRLTQLVGAVLPTTTLFIFSILFLICLSINFAIKISSLADQVKNLAQKVSLLEAEVSLRGGTEQEARS